MKILFQGDSITDAGRSYTDISNAGMGYPHLIKSALGYSEPEKYEFVNLGISGSRIVDTYSRIKSDIINIAPDVMSILLGINDVWHELSHKNGVEAEKFFKIYCMMIEEIKEALPNLKIMILEPFVLRGSNTDGHFEYFKAETAKRAQAAKKVAEKYDLKFIPLQAGFDELESKAPASYWLMDGVHPTPAGHEFIKNEWLRAFAEL